MEKLKTASLSELPEAAIFWGAKNSGSLYGELQLTEY